MNYNNLCDKVLNLLVNIFLFAFFSHLFIMITGMYYELNAFLVGGMLISFILMIKTDYIVEKIIQLYQYILPI